jgi:spermidine synthase
VSPPPEPAGPSAPGPLPAGLAAALVFVASGAVLVLEVVGLRLVGPYVGVTLQTSSAVIGVALAAIAYGAWLGGRLADRYDPRRLLAPALLFAAIATGFTLPVVRYAGEALRGNSAGGVLLLTVLTLFVPAGLLSTIPPLVVKLQLGDLHQTGRVVGQLSSIGTLGGITATLGTGFILVAALPSSVIMLGLVGLLGLGGLALACYLRQGRRSRTGAALAVLGLAGSLLTAAAPNPCDVETAYHCATVTTDPNRPTGRVLWLNSARHSYVDLADPRHLEFAYTQWIGALADVFAPAAQPVRALHLGGGGFTLPRYLAATRPGSDSLVLEIDGELVELDRARLGLRTGPGLRVIVGDARVELAEQPAGSRDLVIGDAFGHLVVPWHLATRELTEQVRRVLRPGGVYALNVIDYPPGRFIRAEVATVAAVFDHVAVVSTAQALATTAERAEVRAGANFVVLASDSPLPLDALRARLAGTGTYGPVEVLAGDQVREFARGGLVLTDDHAPVDQLLVQP